MSFNCATRQGIDQVRQRVERPEQGIAPRERSLPRKQQPEQRGKDGVELMQQEIRLRSRTSQGTQSLEQQREDNADQDNSGNNSRNESRIVEALSADRNGAEYDSDKSICKDCEVPAQHPRRAENGRAALHQGA